MLLYAIRFLTSVNENFPIVKSQILLMDHLPLMDKIFSMMLQQERQGNFAPTSDDSIPLINVVTSRKSKGSYSGSTNKNFNQWSNFNKPRYFLSKKWSHIFK